MNTKTCTKCHRELPCDIEHFHRQKLGKDGFRSTCKECRGSSFGIHAINKVKQSREGFIFCSKCKEELPLNEEHFYKRKHAKNGWSSWCKKCFGAKEYKVTHPNVIFKTKDGYKICACCKKELILSKFSKTKNNSDGHNSSCRKCSSVKSREYQSNPDVKIRKAEYNKEYRVKYYSTEKGKEVNKRNIQLRRSRKAKTVYNYSLGDWEDTLEYFHNECAYCGSDDNIQQEHIIPLSKGGYYTKQNIIPACSFCNASKHNRDLLEWYPKQNAFTEKRLKKINKWAGINNNAQQLSIL